MVFKGRHLDIDNLSPGCTKLSWIMHPGNNIVLAFGYTEVLCLLTHLCTLSHFMMTLSILPTSTITNNFMLKGIFHVIFDPPKLWYMPCKNIWNTALSYSHYSKCMPHTLKNCNKFFPTLCKLGVGSLPGIPGTRRVQRIHEFMIDTTVSRKSCAQLHTTTTVKLLYCTALLFADIVH